MRLFVSLVAILFMATAAAPRLQAQAAHAAPQSALDAAVQQHVDTTAADRDAVLRVLGRSDVKGVAERAGIDLRRATGADSTLQGDDLARVASQARQVEQGLAGGQSRIVLSTTVMSRAGSMRVLIAHITSFQSRAFMSSSTTITHFVYMNWRR